MGQPSSSRISTKKVLFFATLGLCVPIFLVSMGMLAVRSDAKNQELYKQQQAEMIKRIKEREAAEEQFKQNSTNDVTTN